MNKIIAITITAAMLTAMATGCAGGNSAQLSNPVVLDENGDIDMAVALEYETDVDALVAELETKEVDGTKPVSENAANNPNTMAVFNFLRENYGVNMLSAQQIGSTRQYEDGLYYDLTADLPAIKGFDMMSVTSEYANTDDVDMAIEWYQKSGGLVTFTWHWNVPKDIDDPTQGKAFYREEITNFSFKNAVTPGTAEYEQVIHDIDLIAVQLQKLEAAGATVLWRPLHEASGGWFWWGFTDRITAADGDYQKLWYMIYDRLENYHKLSNLIWIWNGQSKALTVSPNTYDISGIDVYPSSEDHSALVSDYNKLAKITDESKMLALTECGYIPDIDEVLESGCTWLYYMPWCAEFVYQPAGAMSMTPMMNLDSIPMINTERMSEEFLIENFANEHLISWNDLPQWEGTEKTLPEHLWLLFPEVVYGTE